MKYEQKSVPRGRLEMPKIEVLPGDLKPTVDLRIVRRIVDENIIYELQKLHVHHFGTVPPCYLPVRIVTEAEAIKEDEELVRQHEARNQR